MKIFNCNYKPLYKLYYSKFNLKSNVICDNFKFHKVSQVLFSGTTENNVENKINQKSNKKDFRKFERKKIPQAIEIYNIKSTKLQPPKISELIDMGKITNPNVSYKVNEKVNHKILKEFNITKFQMFEKYIKLICFEYQQEMSKSVKKRMPNLVHPDNNPIAQYISKMNFLKRKSKKLASKEQEKNKKLDSIKYNSSEFDEAEDENEDKDEKEYESQNKQENDISLDKDPNSNPDTKNTRLNSQKKIMLIGTENENKQSIYNDKETIRLDPLEERLFYNTNFKKLVTTLIQRKIDKELASQQRKVNIDSIPFIPRLAAFEVAVKDDLDKKNYHWCSCGLSKKQPFCDRSHKGTSFQPINFQLVEKTNNIFLCGCKLSKEAPFCDRVTCVNLAFQEEQEIESKVKEILCFEQSKGLEDKKSKEDKKQLESDYKV